LHGYFLLVMVSSPELRVLNGDVFLNVLARKNNLVIFAWAKDAHEGPVNNGNGNTEESSKEEISFETTTVNEREETFEEPRDAKDEEGEDIIRE
jgi:hypothetical protein